MNGTVPDAPGPGSAGLHGEGAPPPPRSRSLLACGLTGLGVTLGLLVVGWLFLRSPWRVDPLRVDVYERLIEERGYVFEHIDDELDGYNLRTRDKGRWAERIYVHPDTGGKIELKRGLWGEGNLARSCTVRWYDPEGVAALVAIAGDFSPYLRRRIEAGQQEELRTGRWVRVTAPDFDCSVQHDQLTLDSRPSNIVGPLWAERIVERVFWRIARLLGRG